MERLFSNTMRKRWWATYAWLILSIMVSFPEAMFALDPTRALSQYGHRAWQIEQGLPQSSVNAVVQTRDGYLWLGTEEGLVRFDGVHFTVFDSAKVPDIRSNSIQVLLATEDGDLWAGTSGGLTRYRGGRFTTFTASDGLPHSYITALSADGAGGLWVGTLGGGLVRFSGGKFVTYSTRDGLAHDEIGALKRTADGSLWIGTRMGMSRLKDGQFTNYSKRDGLSNDWVYALCEDRDGSMWIGTLGGLDHLKDGAFSHYSTQSGLLRPQVRSILVDRQGVVFVGTQGGGLSRLQGGRFTSYTTKDGLSDDQVWNLFEDHEGNLWIGTRGGGLNCLRDTSVLAYGEAEGFPKGSVWGIGGDRSGAIWIASERGGVLRLSKGQLRQYTTREGLLSNEVSAVIEDKAGDIWVGTDAGLNRLSGNRLLSLPAGPNAPVGLVRALYSARDGSLWIGTRGSGVSRYRNGRFTQFTKRNGLSDDWVRVILEDRRGAMWFGTNHGLVCLQGGQFITYDVSSGLPQNSIYALYEDRDGVLWIGTEGGGLVRMNLGVMTTITTRNGLFNDIVYSILEDSAGYFWMSCNQGIFRVSRHELNAFARGKSTRVESKVFDSSDGMKSRECNGGVQPSAWKGADGRLWFPTIGGVVTVDPARIKVSRTSPPVLLQRVVIDRQSIDLSAKVRMPPGRGDLEFEYAGLSFLAPDRVRFKYKLDGFDSDWVDAGTRRTAFYTKVPPGQYTFQVKAANSDGLWSPTGTAFEFELNPAVYQTKWFYGLCLIGLVAFGLGAYGLRIRTLHARARHLTNLVDERTRALQQEIGERKQAQEQALQAQEDALKAQMRAEDASRAKSEFLANMSHELRTPLNAIIGYSELLKEEIPEKDQSTYAPDLDRITLAGKHLLELINGLLDISKIEAGKMEVFNETFNVQSLVDAVLSTAMPLVNKNGNQISVDYGSDTGEMTADQTKLRQILLNLLSNASKFTERGSIWLRITRRMEGGRAWIFFQVQDSGIGISCENQEKLFNSFVQGDASTTRKYGGTGLGLAISRRFCQMMGGDLTVDSEPGKGSTFEFRIPADPIPQKVEEAVSDEFNKQTSMVRDELKAGAPIILVIDDDPLVRDLLARFLSRDGFSVVGCADGDEGLRAAREYRPTAILLDVLMKGRNGWSVLASFKSDPELAKIPVIMVTIVDDKKRGYALGADGYLTKPVNPEMLSEELKRWQNGRDPGQVLVVEDDDSSRELMGRYLRGRGWKVVEASNGVKGLAQLEMITPSLILLDLMMPEMDGFEFLKRLRAEENWQNIPVIVVSAAELTEEQHRMLCNCVSEVVPKAMSSAGDWIVNLSESIRRSGLKQRPSGAAVDNVQDLVE